MIYLLKIKNLVVSLIKYVNSIKLERDFEQLNNFNESRH